MAVSFGTILVPVNMAQAAVFKLTIDGLEGSGEIGFDDESLIGVYEEDVFGTGPVKLVYGSELINGYFNWSFTAEGEGSTEYVDEGYIETYPLTLELNHTEFIGVGGSFVQVTKPHSVMLCLCSKIKNLFTLMDTQLV